MINPFKSRTVWAAVFSLALTTLQTSEALLTPAEFLLAQSVLTALVAYFRANPKQ